MNKRRDSNALVESWFNIVKGHIMRRRMRIPAYKFINKMYKLIEPRILNEKMNLKMTKKSKRKPTKKNILKQRDRKLKLMQYKLKLLQILKNKNKNKIVKRKIQTVKHKIIKNKTKNISNLDDVTLIHKKEEWAKRVQSDNTKHLQCFPKVLNEFSNIENENTESIDNPPELENLDNVNKKQIFSSTIIDNKENIDTVNWGLSTIKEIEGNVNTCYTNWDVTGKSFKDDNAFPLLKNKLVDDISYYKEIENFNYVVGTYEGKVDTLYQKIDIADFHSLSGESWLTNQVVDIVICLLKQNHQEVLYMPSTTYGNIFERDLGDIKINANSNTKKILYSYLDTKRNHYCLLYANMDLKTFSFIDPYGKNEAKYAKNHWSAFKKVLNNNNINTNDYKIQSIKHIKQTDNSNCGPIIIYIADCIINNRDATVINCTFTDYRNKLKYFLLTSSNDVSNFCTECSSEYSKKKSLMIQCSFCNRWVHVTCITKNLKKYHLTSNDIKNLKNIQFKCILCLNNR